MAPRSLRSKLARGALVALGIFVGGDQIAQHAFLSTGFLAGRRVAPFDPPLFARHHFDRLEAYRALLAAGTDPSSVSDFDPDLGWCPRAARDDGPYRIDARGARYATQPVPRERTPGVRRVVALGCSFTFGAEVEGPDAWFARVDEARADLEVVNLAFGAYGLDQALLRWRRDGARESCEEAWLGVLPSAALRNVTTYHPALRHWTNVVHVKPRFELGANDVLVPVASPARSLADLVLLLSDAHAFARDVAPHDLWVQRAPQTYARRGSVWWHHVASLRLAATWLERRGRDARPWLADDTSEVHRLERALVLELARDVAVAQRRLRVLVLPDREDVADARDKDACWKALVAAWSAAGIEVFDASSAFLTVDGDREARFWAPEGHYSAEGNRVVAEAFLQHLARHP